MATIKIRTALKTANCCVAWQVEFQASNITGTVKSDIFCVYMSFSPLINHVMHHVRSAGNAAVRDSASRYCNSPASDIDT